MEKEMKYSDIRIDKASGRSLYLQVADGIVKAIMEGRLRGGMRLMSVRETAESIGVNHKTVEAAVNVLAEAGIVERKARSGVYVSKISACTLGRYLNRYKERTDGASTDAAHVGNFSLQGHHGVSVWMEWDTLGPMYVDGVKRELEANGIIGDVVVSHGAHPAVKLDQGNLSGKEFSALLEVLLRLTPAVEENGTD